jgi:hypothetical protein
MDIFCVVVEWAFSTPLNVHWKIVFAAAKAGKEYPITLSTDKGITEIMEFVRPYLQPSLVAMDLFCTTVGTSDFSHELSPFNQHRVMTSPAVNVERFNVATLHPGVWSIFKWFCDAGAKFTTAF